MIEADLCTWEIPRGSSRQFLLVERVKPLSVHDNRDSPV